jgi:hypothetical protein
MGSSHRHPDIKAGMLVQEHVASLTKPQIPEGLEEELGDPQTTETEEEQSTTEQEPSCRTPPLEPIPHSPP